MRKKLIALFALLSLFAIGACGDNADDTDAASTDDTSEAASGDTLTKEEFIEQGDTICAALEAAGETVEDPQSPEDYPVVLTEHVGQAEEAHKQFAELKPPADGEDVHQALLDALGTSIETVKGAITAFEGGDTVTGEDLLSQASEEGNAADEEARAYGFTECGSEDEAGETEEPADPSQIEEEQPADGSESEEAEEPAEG
ncbi:MAG TPA: hypothetical protein VMY88_05920 [Acidimicrobiales bacterium]|nr:hypothetical protein [Acidimicrobiales bacterium]